MEKFEIKNMLYKVNIKSRALSVMLYLVDRANKDLVCFPSIKTISKDLNISVSTTKRALNYLVEIGYIEKTERFLDTTGKQTPNLYVINVENIKNGKNIDKAEKVIEQEEKQILEMFEQAITEAIKNEIEQEGEDKISTELKEKSDIQDNKIKSTKLKSEMDRDSLSQNINKNLFILEMVKTLCRFKYSNFKSNVLKNIKKLVGMKELLRFGKMNLTPVHFYSTYN